MAVVETKNASSLKIKLNLGLVGGKLKTRSKSYSYLKPDASPDDVHEVGQALMALQKYDVSDIIKIDNTVLTDELI